MAGGGAPTFTQDAYRGRNDDGSESTATWKAGLNELWVQQVDTPFRVRFLISRPSEASNQNVVMSVYVSHNGGAYELCSSAVGTSPVIDIASGSLEPQGTDTTQQLGSGNYLTNNDGVSNGSGDARTNSALWPLGTAYEADFEFALQIVGASVVPGDTLALKVYYNDSILVGGWTNYPTLVVPQPPGVRVQGGTIAIKGGTLKLKGR